MRSQALGTTVITKAAGSQDKCANGIKRQCSEAAGTGDNFGLVLLTLVAPQLGVPLARAWVYL